MTLPCPCTDLICQEWTTTDTSAIVQSCPDLQYIFICPAFSGSGSVQASDLRQLQRLQFLTSLDMYVGQLDGCLASLPAMENLKVLKLSIRKHTAVHEYEEHLPSWISRMLRLEHLFLHVGSDVSERWLWKPSKDLSSKVARKLFSNPLPRNISFIEVRWL